MTLRFHYHQSGLTCNELANSNLAIRLKQPARISLSLVSIALQDLELNARGLTVVAILRQGVAVLSGKMPTPNRVQNTISSSFQS